MIIKNIVASFFLVFIGFPVFSQNIDSLSALLEGKKGPERLDLLFDISYDLLGDNNMCALKYGREGYDLAVEYHDSLRLVRAGLVTASALRRLQRFDSAYVVYSSINRISERNRYLKELSLGLNSLGAACVYLAQYDKALASYFQALELGKLSGDTTSQISVLNNIGIVYYKLKNYQKALEVFLDSYAMQQVFGDHKDEAMLLVNIGHCYAYLERYADALTYIDKGLRVCSASCPPGRVMIASFAKGVVYFGLQDMAKAEELFLRSYAIAKELNDIRIQLDNIDYLSQLYMKQDLIGAATFYLTVAETLIKTNRPYNLEKIKIYSRLSELSLKTKNFEEASFYQRKYILVKDSVYDEEMTINLMRIESEFLERENTRRILAQNEVLALKEEIISHQKIFNRIVALFAFISVGFVILIFRNYQNKKKINLLLDQRLEERTRAFEQSYYKLSKALEEKGSHADRLSRHVAGNTVRIKSLCSVALQEVLDPVAVRYLEKINSSAELISRHIAPQLQENRIP